MSTLASPLRAHAPRTAGAAFDRARLALVPVRRSRAPRAPFAVLVLLVLGAGVVGLLMFNTHMQQASFYATKLQHRADALAAKRETLEMEVASLQAPQRLALQARREGMVVPPNPADLDLATGKISGEAVAAGSGDAMRVSIPARHKPRRFDLAPVVHKVYLPGSKPGAQPATKPGAKPGATKPGAKPGATKNSGQSQPSHGPASR